MEAHDGAPCRLVSFLPGLCLCPYHPALWLLPAMPVVEGPPHRRWPDGCTCLAQRAEQEQLVQALEGTLRLSTLRYEGGLDSYLQVLDAQRNLFSGELGLAQLRLAERLAVVQLYRALGGGWQ